MNFEALAATAIVIALPTVIMGYVVGRIFIELKPHRALFRAVRRAWRKRQNLFDERKPTKRFTTFYF